MYYTIKNTNLILRISDNAVIPAVLNNSDYTEYVRWLSDGNIPEEIDGIPMTEVLSDHIITEPTESNISALNLAANGVILGELETIVLSTQCE